MFSPTAIKKYARYQNKNLELFPKNSYQLARKTVVKMRK